MRYKNSTRYKIIVWLRNITVVFLIVFTVGSMLNMPTTIGEKISMAIIMATVIGIFVLIINSILKIFIDKKKLEDSGHIFDTGSPMYSSTTYSNSIYTEVDGENSVFFNESQENSIKKKYERIMKNIAIISMILLMCLILLIFTPLLGISTMIGSIIGIVICLILIGINQNKMYKLIFSLNIKKDLTPFRKSLVGIHKYEEFKKFIRLIETRPNLEQEIEEYKKQGIRGKKLLRKLDVVDKVDIISSEK